jgi:Protein of unknown function (DUF3606)
MVEEKKMRMPRDATRINLEERHEVEYWTRELGVSEHRLHELVAKLGGSVTEIRGALGRSRQPIRLPRRRQQAEGDL